jgi:hypothetical protein
MVMKIGEITLADLNRSKRITPPIPRLVEAKRSSICIATEAYIVFEPSLEFAFVNCGTNVVILFQVVDLVKIRTEQVPWVAKSGAMGA